MSCVATALSSSFERNVRLEMVLKYSPISLSQSVLLWASPAVPVPGACWSHGDLGSSIPGTVLKQKLWGKIAQSLGLKGVEFHPLFLFPYEIFYQRETILVLL